jgi:hypothetical protein
MVATVEADTAEVVTLKVAVVLPEATTTVAGTEIEEELLLIETETPPVGAA